MLCRGTLSTRFGHGFLVHFFEGYALVVVIEFQKLHFVIAFRTIQRVIAEREEDGSPPLSKTAVDLMFFFGNDTMQFRINLTVPCIQTAIADHFKMFFRDVRDEPFYEIHDRQSFLHILVVFMAVIVESNGISIISVNPGCGYDGSAKIAADVFSDHFRVAKVRLGIDIEAVFVLAVAFGFYFFKGRTYFAFHFIEESRAESITQIVVVKMFYMAPKAVITVPAFGKETVDVRIPFEIPAKSMEDHDISGSVIFSMVQVEKHP